MGNGVSVKTESVGGPFYAESVIGRVRNQCRGGGGPDRYNKPGVTNVMSSVDKTLDAESSSALVPILHQEVCTTTEIYLQ